MDLKNCHGIDENEIATYSKITANEVLSVAYYGVGGKHMQPFVHSHENYEFILPCKTIPILRYEEANYIGEVGYCYPVNPGVKHGLGFVLDSELYSIVVDGEYLDSVKEKLCFDGRWFYTRFIEGKRLVFLINRFIVNPSESLSNEIISMLVRDGLSIGVDNRRPTAAYVANIKESISFMMEHYIDPNLTIKEVAENSHFAYTYFTKAFARYMHDTPINHLNKIRLSKAKQLMQESPSLSLEEIALKSGFKSGSAFTEAFKRILGISPKVYRKTFL